MKVESRSREDVNGTAVVYCFKLTNTGDTYQVDPRQQTRVGDEQNQNAPNLSNGKWGICSTLNHLALA
jgi:hypothetical protein